MLSICTPRVLGSSIALLLPMASVAAQDTLAYYNFSNESMADSASNSDVNAADITVNRAVQYASNNICVGSDWSTRGGYFEIVVAMSNPIDRVDLASLRIDYEDYGGNLAVNSLEVFADEDPGPGGDNFSTSLFATSNIERDITVDLSAFSFLQNAAGPVTIRIEYWHDDPSNAGRAMYEIDDIKLRGHINRLPSQNPCVGPQVYFGDRWHNGSYTVGGTTPQWFFPNWSSHYDVACIDDGNASQSTHIPAIWVNECSIGCRALEFYIKGRNNGDDDSIGFTLGFCDGDQNNPDADYLAVIWNGAEQTAQFPNHCESVTKPVGLHLVRVTGIPDPAEFLGQTNLACTPASSGVELLQEATNLADTSWTPGTPHAIRVEMEINSLRVWVDGTLEIERAGDYSSYVGGCFGYYSQSQFSDFWGLEVTPLNPVVASWSNYGTGLAGCGGIPSLTMLANPIMGTQGQVAIGNDGPAVVPTGLFVSLSPEDLFIPLFGGNLYVAFPLAGVVPLHVPPGGTIFECAVPDDSCVAGVSLYWQAIGVDSCGPNGFSMSPGLQMTLGDY